MKIPKQFLGAFKAGHRPSAREFIDEELSFQMLERWYKSNGKDKEATETLEYLTRFNNEFHKNVVKKDDPKALHKTPEQRKSLYDRENARNRDIMSVRKDQIEKVDDKSKDASNDEGAYSYPTGYDAFIKHQTASQYEDTLIDLLDALDAIEQSFKN